MKLISKPDRWRCRWCGDRWAIRYRFCLSCWVFEGVKRKRLLVLVCLVLGLGGVIEAQPRQKVVGYASYYTQASCRREGTSGIMANGRKLDDQAFTAASWDYGFGQPLQVCTQNLSRCVRVTVTDRGPARRLYRRGRIIDLSQAAFKALASLKLGCIKVVITLAP